jgi:hypothetical protein
MLPLEQCARVMDAFTGATMMALMDCRAQISAKHE